MGILSLSGGFSASCAASRGAGGGSGVPPGGSATAPRAGGGATAVSETALGSLTIRKWKLENGLGIITVPDPRASSVSYVTTYRVGSRDEDAAAGETGLAHLFEHLMFAGSGKRSDGGDFDQRLEEVGGSSNAVTSYDFTSYTNDVPPQALGRAILLEADRMVNLDLGPRQIANERSVVVEERLGSVEDSVDGLLDEMMWQQAFRSHPYRWPIIGRMQDIKSITREKAVAFYRRHYAPDRAVIAVAGRFDEAAVLDAVGAAYGRLPSRGPMNAAVIPPERAPAASVRASIERPVPADRLLVGFPAPGLNDPDRAAYELMGELLLGGPSSRLYRFLIVERELCSSIVGDVAPTRDPGLWSVWVQMTEGHEAREAEEVILREVEQLIAQPVSPEELSAATNRLETAFWQELTSSRGRAEALGQFDAVTGDCRDLIARGSAYRRVTAGDLGRVARAYLGTGARSVVIARPQNNVRKP